MLQRKVAVGLICDKQDRVLLSKRTARQSFSGCWEFPGGKCHVGEPTLAALKRELLEEIGMIYGNGRPLISFFVGATRAKFWLEAWQVRLWSGEIYPREGQEMSWVPKEKISCLSMPPANHGIVGALLLPHIAAILPLPKKGFSANALDRLEACLESGLRLVQIRAEGQGHPSRDIIDCCRLCHHYGASVIFNDADSITDLPEANGVHIKSRFLMALDKRPVAKDRLFGASCHNAQELSQARRLDADFVFLSPVLETASHPEAKPLSWKNFANLVTATANMPVYALGGMAPETLPCALQHQSHGIAMKTALWDSADPATQIKRCLDFTW